LQKLISLNKQAQSQSHKGLPAASASSERAFDTAAAAAASAAEGEAPRISIEAKQILRLLEDTLNAFKVKNPESSSVVDRILSSMPQVREHNNFFAALLPENKAFAISELYEESEVKVVPIRIINLGKDFSSGHTTLEYPQWFLKMRGHYFHERGLVSGAGSVFKNHEKINTRLAKNINLLDKLPEDLMQIFFDLNKKIRRNIRPVVKPSVLVERSESASPSGSDSEILAEIILPDRKGPSVEVLIKGLHRGRDASPSSSAAAAATAADEVAAPAADAPAAVMPATIAAVSPADGGPAESRGGTFVARSQKSADAIARGV
jgi:hypothetical protein